jgi:uncharacterized protein (TIGR02118 family)
MFRMLVLYPRPDDAEAFDRHYFDVHVPLATQLDGLRRFTVSRNAAPIRGETTYHLVAELDWDSKEALQAAFASETGRATGRDAATLAQLCPGMHSVAFEVEELT